MTRRNSQKPPEAGGWNIFITSLSGAAPLGAINPGLTFSLYSRLRARLALTQRSGGR